MDLFKFLGNASDANACDHTRQKLQRRLLPKPELKLGLPGVGTAISIKRKQPDYIYHCPACGKDLSLNDNSRWETLYSSYKAPAPQKISKPGQRIKSYGSTGKRTTTSGYKREPIGSKLRYDILTRDKNRCVKCGAKGGENELHIDHKKPVSMGGTNDPSNLQTLCSRCNLGKGARIG